MKKCPFCAETIQHEAIKCRFCGEFFLKPAPGTSVLETPGGDTYRVVDTAQGPRLWMVNTLKGYIDFTGDRTGVRLPSEVIAKLEARGVNPTTRFLSRSAAHRLLMEVGWTSPSGKRVGPSPFYEEGAPPKKSEHRATAGPPPRDPYEILGVARCASGAEIRAAYITLIKQYHPDRVAHLGPELRELAHRKAQAITHAYQLLSGERQGAE